MTRMLLTTGIMLALSVQVGLGELKEKPSGAAIADKARQAKFLAEKKVTRDWRDGKKFHMTPADVSHVKSAKQMEEGHVIAYLETDVPGKAPSLPPGKYHVHLAKVNGEWRLHYVDSRGKMAAEMKADLHMKPAAKSTSLVTPTCDCGRLCLCADLWFACVKIFCVPFIGG